MITRSAKARTSASGLRGASLPASTVLPGLGRTLHELGVAVDVGGRRPRLREWAAGVGAGSGGDQADAGDGGDAGGAVA